MGMFDDVILPEPIPCPRCGTPNVAFQSKDGECELAKLAPQDVDHFYTICVNRDCEEWIQFDRKRPIPRPVTAWQQDFEMSHRGRGV